MTQRPFVLHIDDEPQTLGAWSELANDSQRIELQVVHPNDVTQELLDRASLVLVDLILNDWPEREQVALALRSPNGLSLMSNLQQLAEAGTEATKARSFALYTGKKDEIAGQLPPRAHILARANNLEWVFDKPHHDEAAPARNVERVAALAQATAALPNPWPADSAATARAALKAWLGLSDEPDWAAAAWRSVLRCRPPLHGFAAHTHGVGILRWMLHKILPYPCFLLDRLQLAARMHVSEASLKMVLNGDSELKRRLDGARYAGQLETFDGPRWWRSGIDTLMFDLSQAASDGLATSQLGVLAPEVEVLPWEAAFPVLKPATLKQERLASSSDVVEVLPDDWPPYADQAWVAREDLAADARLRSLVIGEED